jgi:intracellular sulfur oxidation DsrE/DsrF family protein
VNKKILLIISTVLFGLSSMSVIADDDHKHRHGKECPVASPYTDASGNTLTFEDKFGPGTLELMNCLKKRKRVKLVMQINQGIDGKGRPYGLRNLQNMINDYKITHGMRDKDFDISVIVHSAGFPFILDPDAATPHPMAANNTFAGMVKGFMAKGVKFYFCMNTGAALNIKTNQMIPGIEYVTAGLTAVTDFQYQGYKYVQP